MVRKGNAVWQGGFKDGKGHVSVESGMFTDAPYGFKSRFESAPETNPEELLGAAHSACFSMALSVALGEAGLVPEKIATTSEITFEKGDGGFAITKSHLTVEASVPGATADQFMEIANGAKAGCPVSKLFKAEITMDAKLV